MHPLDAFMIVFSEAGRFLLWLAFGVAGILLGRARRMGVWQMCLAMIVAAIMSEAVLKPLVHAARPFDVDLHALVIGARPSSYSFPSGHAASAFAAAVALSRAWPGGRLAWFALAALVAYSRLYLGVHYPIDVIGGALLGLACGLFAVGRTQWEPVSQSGRSLSP